ncbi:prepilin peptidase [Caulobacter sp. NIBR2454]|uniref:prepilin peptidase n=1 Tax=Caulobacter sp. NIBR2454 TaxID=3015996 RepID=UPI002FC2E5AF
MGSFIGLVSVRLPAGESLTRPGSTCGSCGTRLGVLDLMPILSFLLWRGRCRRCGGKIPLRYPLIELACLGIAVWAALTGAGASVFLTALLGWQLLLLAVLDAEHFWLPGKLTWPLLALGLAVSAAEGSGRLMEGLIGAAIGFALFAGLSLAYRRLRGRDGLGGGDWRLLAAGGAWVGWLGLPSILLWAAVSGLIAVLAKAAVTRSLRGDERVPFGVFLAAGIWLTWLYGPLGA